MTKDFRCMAEARQIVWPSDSTVRSVFEFTVINYHQPTKQVFLTKN